jgi:hypothetical protein
MIPQYLRLVLVFIVTLSSCADIDAILMSNPTTPFKPVEVIPQNKGLIYFYRHIWDSGVLYDVGITINGMEVVKLSSGMYYPYFSDVGEVEISTTYALGRTETVGLYVKAGEIHFMKISVYGGSRPIAFLSVMTKAQGESEVT